MSDMIEYILIGSMKGRSGKFMGQVFRQGKAMIPKDVHIAINHLLRDDYSAIPLYDFNEEERLKKMKEETVLTPAVTDPSEAPTETVVSVVKSDE